MNASAAAAARESAPRVDVAEIERAVSLIAPPGGVVEVRALNTKRLGRIGSGYFDNVRALVKAVEGLSGYCEGVYATLNPINPALIARAANEIRSHAQHTTADADIIARRWLLVDCDARRPSGISATDAEHAAAIDSARRVRDSLTELYGWPRPIVADSGNGAHLLYRVDLPNDDTARDLIKRVLEAVAAQFNNEVVQIDRTTFNAARISKLYGTLAAKGSWTAERPYRLARILEAPATRDDVKVVTRAQLEEVAAPAAEPRTRTTQSRTNQFDLEQWLDRYGIAIARRESWGGGERLILEQCPFDAAHGGTSVAILKFPSGGFEFRCQHNGCADRRWADVRELFEPGYKDRRQDQQAHAHGQQANAESVRQAGNYREAREGLSRVEVKRAHNQDIEILHPLTNFRARIVSDSVRDDGVERTREARDRSEPRRAFDTLQCPGRTFRGHALADRETWGGRGGFRRSRSR